jgi:predicted transporter
MGGKGRAVSWALGGTMMLVGLYYLANALYYLANFTIK